MDLKRLIRRIEKNVNKEITISVREYRQLRRLREEMEHLQLHLEIRNVSKQDILDFWEFLGKKELSEMTKEELTIWHLREWTHTLEENSRNFVRRLNAWLRKLEAVLTNQEIEFSKRDSLYIRLWIKKLEAAREVIVRILGKEGELHQLLGEDAPDYQIIVAKIDEALGSKKTPGIVMLIEILDQLRYKEEALRKSLVVGLIRKMKREKISCIVGDVNEINRKLGRSMLLHGLTFNSFQEGYAGIIDIISGKGILPIGRPPAVHMNVTYYSDQRLVRWFKPLGFSINDKVHPILASPIVPDTILGLVTVKFGFFDYGQVDNEEGFFEMLRKQGFQLPRNETEKLFFLNALANAKIFRSNFGILSQNQIDSEFGLIGVYFDRNKRLKPLTIKREMIDKMIILKKPIDDQYTEEMRQELEVRFASLLEEENLVV